MRLIHPFSAIIGGPSNSGKTYFVKMIIDNMECVISKPIENIVYIYSCWQEVYDHMLAVRHINFIQGLPATLADDTLLPPEKNNLLIVDDLMSEGSQSDEMQCVFTKYVHHRNLSCLYLMQNIFCQGKTARSISLNTNYLILYKNVRDRSQIMYLARQMFPHQTNFFLDSYLDATSKPYGYLLIDYKSTTPDIARLRTDILQGLADAKGSIVYVPRTKK